MTDLIALAERVEGLTKVYAGIGSRETPPDVCTRMLGYAHYLRGLGWTLRSGGAEGADAAFARGAGGKAEIFRPQDATDEALALAARFHPAWDRCSTYAKRLHARNGFQVLGRDLRSPSSFVICWTKDGKASGGTGQAIRIAMAHKIPVFNLRITDDEQALAATLRAITEKTDDR